MHLLFTIVCLALVFAAGFFLTTKVIPKGFLFLVRRLGFQMTISPVTEKRIRRFQSIKRGYYSFLLVLNLLVLSFFLELLVNNKALAIYYNGNIAFPAVKEWMNNFLPGISLSYFNKASDFGLSGEGEVDYRLFREYCKDPSPLAEKIKEKTALVEHLAQKMSQYSPQMSAEEKRKWEEDQYQHKKASEEIATLKESLEKFQNGKAWVVMPLYPYSYRESFLSFEGKRPPYPPMQSHPLGSDDTGRDVLCQVTYGFRVSLSFALLVATAGYIVGVIVGGVMGYYGGWTDIVLQRFIEIWSSIPFLFTIMIIASIVKINFVLMVLLLVTLRSWMGITYTVRGEFYREKAKDYVQAAIAMGNSDWKVMIRHILPNSLVPVLSYAPFAIVSYITLLVSLDYLGYGLPSGTPSWGTLLQQGTNAGYIMHYPHLIVVPATAFAATLFLVVLIGEAVREAFDPKHYSRLR